MSNINLPLDKNLTVKEFSERYGISLSDWEDGEEPEGLQTLRTLRKNYCGAPYHAHAAILVMIRWVYLPEKKDYGRLPEGLAQNCDNENYTFGRKGVFERPGDKDPKDCYPIVLEGLSVDSTVEEVIHQIWDYVKSGKREGFQQYVKEVFGISLGVPMLKRCEDMVEAGVHQIVLTGAPGTGKTYTAEEFAEDKIIKEDEAKNKGLEANTKDSSKKRKLSEEERNKYICKVQFHSSYDYSDFVEGLRPVMQNNQMVFVRMDGQFKKFCREIVENGEKGRSYFFIIDEINRADLSRVFGELMYCLDEDNRGKPVVTQYSNLPTYAVDDDGSAHPISEDVFQNGFYIPENLYILATMNDIDRSVEAFDFALRRRFKWIRADAKEEAEHALKNMLIHEWVKRKIKDKELEEIREDIKKESSRIEEEIRVTKEKDLEPIAKEELTDEIIDVLKGKIEKLNKAIFDKESKDHDEDGGRLGLSEDYHIGHAYFKNYTLKPAEEEDAQQNEKDKSTQTKEEEKAKPAGKKDNLEEIWNTQIEPILQEYCRGKDPGTVTTFIAACKKALLDKENSTTTPGNAQGTAKK